MTKQDQGLAGHSALSQVQWMGTATTQPVWDAMAEDCLSFLTQHHHPFLPLLMVQVHESVQAGQGSRE